MMDNHTHSISEEEDQQEYPPISSSNPASVPVPSDTLDSHLISSTFIAAGTSGWCWSFCAEEEEKGETKLRCKLCPPSVYVWFLFGLSW